MATFGIKITLISPLGGETVGVVNSHSVVIGRSSKCDFVVDSESLSRTHCRIDYENNQFFITDLGSSNGVYIDGVRISAEKKTRFNNILPLQISQYDCFVSEVESELAPAVPPAAKDQFATVTRATRKVNIQSLNAPLEMRNEKTGKQKIPFKLIFSTLAFVSCILFLVVLQFKDEPTDPMEEVKPIDPIQALLKEPAPKITPLIANEFLPPADYLQNHAYRNCDETVYCENLYLSAFDHEGLVKIDKSFLIYMKPSKHLTKEKYLKLTEQEADLIALDLFLTSRILDDYLMEEFTQLHLIIVGANNGFDRVYRFHPAQYNLNSAKRDLVYPILQSSIALKDPKPFWDVFTPLLSVLQLPQ